MNISLAQLRAYAKRDLPDWSTNPYSNRDVLALIDAVEAAEAFIRMASDMTRGEKRNEQTANRLAKALDRFDFE